ncbi:hypothetical protein C8Q79DRAFT_868163, partial [Trametes meyenii]
VYSTYKITHLDISAGNVLVFPALTRHENKGGKWVKWNGLLTDWELVKCIVDDAAQVMTRQLERTGTWQSMSAAYVAANWTRPIEMADELESFHVMLFYVVR